MDGVDVSSQVIFLCKAFATALMWAGEGGRRDGVGSFNVSVK